MSLNTTRLAVVPTTDETDKCSAAHQTADQVQEAINAILARFAKNEEGYSAHKAFLDLYRQIADDLNTQGADVLSLRNRIELLKAQGRVVDVAAALPANGMTDCAYKLALWRHDYVRYEDEVWPKGDILAATVLEDLIAMTGETEARFVEHEDFECV